jgi:phosphoribosyl 1,2-cyclic phosphate phosphodiesterase
MKLTLLGTGTSQGVPVVACSCKVCHSADPRDTHLRTSALIETDEGLNILIDIGPDFREQMLHNNVMHLDAILITHAHRDHVAGLDDIRSYNYVQRRSMDLYGNSVAMETIRRDYHYIFSDHRYPGLPEANLLTLTGSEVLHVGRQMVQPVRGLHKDLPVLGYRIGPIGYITDMNHIEVDELNKMKGVQILVVNALRHEPHFSHFCLSEALAVIAEIQPKQAFITHISHQMGLYADVEKELPSGVLLGYDNVTVVLPANDANYEWQVGGRPQEYRRPQEETRHEDKFYVGPSSSANCDQQQSHQSGTGLPYYSDSSAPSKQ